MSNYYIDYENVHNEGLKGVQRLQQGDRLHLFYSVKADTLKIDVVRQLMECPAEICFDKIINGVENALDFQLITALMCNYDVQEDYYIISRDKGYDAAIEMAGKQNRCNIYRCKDIEGAIKPQDGLGIDESDQEIIVDLGDLSSADAPGQALDADTTADDAAELPRDAAENTASLAPAQESHEEKEAANEEKDAIPEAVQEQSAEEAVPGLKEKMEEIFLGRQNPEENQVQEPEAKQEIQNDEAPAEQAVLTEDEIKRRAHQSICTKILNHVKLIQKIPLVYKQAEYICEALEDSDTKMQFYHRLLQSLGRKKGGELYQKIKAVYKSIRSIYQASMAGEEQPDDNSAQAVPEPAEQLSAMSAESKEQIEQHDEAEPQEREKPQRIAKRGRGIRTTRSALKNPRGKKRTRPEADSEPIPDQQVEAVRAAFEQAEQQQGSAGEAILQMVELAKNI